MKKIISTLVIGLAFIAAFAAEQYSGVNQNEGAAIAVTGNATLALTFLNPDGSAADFSSVFPSGYNHFGYYLMDAKNNMLSWAAVDLSGMVDGKVVVGDFSAGDRIAFWAANDSGEYMDSMHRNGEKNNTRDSAYVGNNGDIIITMGKITGQGWGPMDLSAVNGSINYTFLITDGTGTSGQPLPGVAAVLLIGGAAAAARHKLKKT